MLKFSGPANPVPTQRRSVDAQYHEKSRTRERVGLFHRCFIYFIPSSLHNRTLLMPQGTPFHGLIPPFPIRVDQFDALPGVVPALHLLSHTHSDHILGLSAKSFASMIICSSDAKQMLLRYEAYSERALRDVDLRDEARLSRAFGHLKIPPFLKDGRLDFSASRDLLVCRIHMQVRGFLLTFKPENPPPSYPNENRIA